MDWKLTSDKVKSKQWTRTDRKYKIMWIDIRYLKGTASYYVKISKNINKRWVNLDYKFFNNKIDTQTQIRKYKREYKDIR